MPMLQMLNNVIFWSSLHVLTINGQEIYKHPSSLLIPVNTIGNFSCVCNGSCHGNWVINDSYTDMGHERSKFEKIGFAFSPPEKSGPTLRTYKLTVNASEAINNTVLFCDFEATGDSITNSIPTRTATLLVISKSPIIPNPCIKLNSTQLSLLWSPPFLWPGQRIDYYNISFFNKSDGNITYYRVNSTFSDQVVKLTTTIHLNKMYTTAQLEFTISPVNVSGHVLPTVNVTGWITPGPLYIVNTDIVATAMDSVTKASVTDIHSTSNNFISVPYKVAIGICVSVITILLLILIILIVCATHLHSRHFKRRTYRADMRSKDTKARSYNNMVHNPIYTGLSSPVYDSIWPLPETFAEIPSSADHRFHATSSTKALQGMNAECAPNKMQQNESLRW